MSENSHNCAYQENQLRCRYHGAISDGTTGQGPWYRRLHARDRGSMIASQVLRASQTWRPEPVAEDTTWIDENFPMQAGETQQEYNRRCRDFSLPALNGFRPKPVVSNAVGGPRPAPGSPWYDAAKPAASATERAADLVVF